MHQTKRIRDNIQVIFLEGNLKGLEDYMRQLREEEGIRYVVLDFDRITRIQTEDTFEIIGASSALKKNNIELYFCNLGECPYETLRLMGITKLANIYVGEDLEKTVANLLAAAEKKI
jgi:anti-anti-sigma regulatory factor